jgi:hypothetical protein
MAGRPLLSALAKIEPRHAVPRASLVAQGIWAAVLVLRLLQLFTIVFIEVLLFTRRRGDLRSPPQAAETRALPGVRVQGARLLHRVVGIIAVNTLFESQSNRRGCLLALGCPLTDVEEKASRT